MPSLGRLRGEPPRFPNLFIVGAAKCGTTSLHAYLASHPDIFMSKVKEPHYFAHVDPIPELKHAVREYSLEEYLGLFKRATTEKYVGESSPSYLWDEDASSRIADFVPSAKIVIILRDPIKRAFSHYRMDCREGLQQADFYTALRQDRAAKPKVWGGASHLYVELGMYFAQVKRFLDVFGHDQVLVLESEKLHRIHDRTMEDVAAFLDVDPNEMPPADALTRRNEAVEPKSLARPFLQNRELRKVGRGLLPPSTRRYLRRHWTRPAAEVQEPSGRAVRYLQSAFRDDLASLEELLGRPLPTLRQGWADVESDA